jgi:hypothetical protein
MIRSLFSSATVLMAILAVSGHLHAQTLCFERNGELWKSNLDGNQAKRIIDKRTMRHYQISDPAISPNGQTVAFTLYHDTASKGFRIIALYSIKDASIRELDSVPIHNAFGPQWSHSGQELAFHILRSGLPDRSVWEVGAISVNNSHFRYLSEAYKKDHAEIFAFGWLKQPNALLGYRVSIDHLLTVEIYDSSGRLIDKTQLSFTSDDGESYFSSMPGNMCLSPYGNRFVLSDVYSDRAPGLLQVDLSAHRVSVLATPNLAPLDACWLPSGDKLVFSAIKSALYRPDDHGPQAISSIYTLDLRTKRIEKVLSNASNPTVSLE